MDDSDSAEDTAIANEISRLLQVYGAEAADCLETLRKLLKNRVDQQGWGATSTITSTENKNYNSSSSSPSKVAETTHEGDTLLPAQREATIIRTTGNVESIVLQTLQIEQQREDHSHNDMESMVQAGVNVIRYWAILQERTVAASATTTANTPSRDANTHLRTREESEAASRDIYYDKPTDIQENNTSTLVITDALCEIMTKYPQNESIQEAACVRLSKLTSPLPMKAATTTTTMTMQTSDQTMQRVLFPVLQAMNWHKNNPVLWNGGMIVLTRLLAKQTIFSSLNLSERQSHAMTLIDLTGGLAIFFDALLKNTSSSKVMNANKSIQTELKSNVCKALAALAVNHPANQALIAQQPKALSTLLDTMKLSAFDVPLQQSLLRLLASLAYGPVSKPLLLAKGGLDCILTSMKDHHLDEDIQATGCRAIANVFAGTSGDIRVKGSLCVKPTLRAMRMHPPQHLENTIETSNRPQDATDESSNDDDENLSSVQIHFYGCAALRNLSMVHSRAIIDAGGIATLLVTLSEYPNRPAIQEQAWGALYGLLRNECSTKEDCLCVCTEGGLQTLLQMLRHYPSHGRIQSVGLGCLACLSSTEHLPILEQIVSGHGLDLILATLHRYHKQGPSELLQSGSLVLANVTKNNPDFQLALIIKNGINILFMVLQQAMDEARVQMAACRTICHLCRNPNNLPQFAVGGGSSSNTAIIPILLSILQAHPNYAELNICVIEILSLLASIPAFQKEFVARKVLKLVVDIMKTYDPPSFSLSRSPEEDSRNLEARDQILLVGCIFLSNVSKDHDATLWMKNHDMIPYLQGLEKQLPRRSPSRSTVRDLISHLQNARVFLAKFGNLNFRKGR